MNKRFFTLMAAVMLAGAPLCNEAYAALATNANDVTAVTSSAKFQNGTKFILSNGTKYYKTAEVANTQTRTNYATAAATTTTDLAEAAVFEVANVKVNPLGITFELKVNGKPFALKTNAHAVETTSSAAEIFTTFTASLTSGSEYTLVNMCELKALESSGVSSTEVLASSKFYTRGLDYNNVNLNDFNANSTTFSFPGENLEGNVFNSVVPFTFGVNDLASVSAAGTYFVKGAAADVKALKEAGDANARKAALKKLSVVAVLNEVYGINTGVAGEGYKLALISGADFYKENDAANFDNAAFTGIKEDQLNNAGEIVLTIKPDLKNVASGTVFAIQSVKASASDTKTYVTTVATGSTSKFNKVSNPTLGDNTYFAATEFLKADKISAFNIYAISGTPGASEYHKYYVTSRKADYSAYENSFKAAKDAQLTNPAAQWIATGFDGKYTLKLQNRLNKAQTLELRLAATDNAGEYKVSGGESGLVGKTIKLLPATLTKYDGSLELSKEQMEEGVTLSFSGQNASIGKQTFYAKVKGHVTGTGTSATTSYSLAPTLEESNADKLIVTRVDNDPTNQIVKYAYLDAAGAVVSNNEAKADTLIVPAYKFSFKIDGKKYVVKNNFDLDATEANASIYWINKTLDGSYTLNYTTAAYSGYDTHVSAEAAIGVEAKTAEAVDAVFNVTEKQYYTPSNEKFNKFGVNVDNYDYVSLPAVSRHATFEAVNVAGGVSMQVNKKGILEGIIGADALTFWLDTADSEKANPLFYISKGIKAAKETKAYNDEVRNFLVYAPDSMKYFNEASASYKTNTAYVLEGTDNLKAFFHPAALIAEDTMTTVVKGKEVTVVAKDADATKNQINALKNFQFGIRLADKDVADEYVIYSKANPSKYLYSHNGKLGFGSAKQALVVTLGEGDATANEAIAAENVAVIAGEGVVTVKGAAGKQVVVSNILGQVIANKVATSDEETIAVAAGVAVVVVDGEATKVVVK